MMKNLPSIQIMHDNNLEKQLSEHYDSNNSANYYKSYKFEVAETGDYQFLFTVKIGDSNYMFLVANDIPNSLSIQGEKVSKLDVREYVVSAYSDGKNKFFINQEKNDICKRLEEDLKLDELMKAYENGHVISFLENRGIKSFATYEVYEHHGFVNTYFDVLPTQLFIEFRNYVKSTKGLSMFELYKSNEQLRKALAYYQNKNSAFTNTLEISESYDNQEVSKPIRK